MGNWKYLDEDIQEDELFSEKSNDFESTGTKISVTLPEDKRLRLIRAVLEPTTYENTQNYCYVDILFGGLGIGSIFYGHGRVSDTEERREVMLHGDGIRKLEVNVTGISGQFSVRLEGYYIDATHHTPHKPLRISAVATSPDNIVVLVDAPEDNGGLPLTQLEWFRTKTPLNESTWILIHTKNMTAEDGPEIQFTDNSLDDNEEYFYKVRGKNSSGAGQFSSVVSARTEIDHPAQIPSLTATPYNSTQVKLIVVLPTDTGGVPLQGIRFERSLLESSGFGTIVQNTGNLNTEYIDTGLDTNTPYYYRAFAINTDNKESLIPSAVASATPVYDAPTNLTVTSENEDAVARLSWTAPVDTNGKSVQKSKVFRRLAGSGSFTLLGEVTGDGTTYDDNTIQGNKVYEYYVIAVIDGEDSPQSVTSSVIIPIRKPAAPTNLTAITKSHNKIDLTWDDPTDDGGSPLVANILSYSKDSNFANATDVELGLVNSHSIISLDHDTQYFFKVQAKNALHSGAESTVTNSTTFKILFGESTEDLVVAEGEIKTIVNEKYRHITNNGTILLTSYIPRWESYDEGTNGKIVVEKTGCLGGDAGITIAGTKGTDPYSGSLTIRTDMGQTEAPQVPPTNGQLIAPGIAVACTDLNNISGIIDNSLDVDSFETQFINNIIGGKGSDGTAASLSGNGGAAGARATYNRSGPEYLLASGEDGGDGGLAAQGADGVRGGGKVALYIRSIVNKITILASGNDGNNGNKGTADPGEIGNKNINCARGEGRTCSGPGQDGTDASSSGTLGSKGSQGGLVILVYESIPDENDISVDVSGGLGGFGGQTATHPDELTTVRNDSGDDGVFVVKTYQELLDSQ